jgi:predicted TIM-barrel fold metal-dependent hydrolase
MTIRDEAFLGRPISTFVVDAHTHIGPCYARGWYIAPGEVTNFAVVASMDRIGINCIVTASHQIILGMMKVANENTLMAIDEYPGRIYGYISVCPGEGLDSVKAELKKYENHPGFLGLKMLAGAYHGSLKQREYQYAADFANEKSCVVLIHTWNNKPPLNEIETFASQHSNIKVLCAHQGGGESNLTYQLTEIMKNQPNIYMEISGSLRNTLAIEDMVSLVGEDRVIYGSDLINLDPRYDFGRVVFSPLQDRIKEKILSGNFLSLLLTSQMGKIAT